jgi:polyisoprenyl-teichoic acid--peptidoglycan teichoic acid transferase
VSRARHALVALVAVGLLASAGSALALERWLLPSGDGELLTLLLLGSDDGPPRSGQLDRANADGFQLLFVSGDRQHATFVSIPRDSYVPVPNQGRTRINACLFNGPERCVATVESVFGVEVDGYLLTSMRAFTRGVERFGGIEVEVPQRLRVGEVSISSGLQTLDGPEALVYARDRKSRSSGDIGRSQAQAQLLAAAHRQVRDDGSPGEVFRALTALRRHTVTDLAGPQLVRLAFESLQLPPSNVERTVLPGNVGFAGPASVYFLEDRAYGIVSDAADDARLS